jgi:serine phosphatase RsbU (regulator of sigma subunit)
MGAVVVLVVLVRRALDALPLLSLGPAFASLAGEVLYLLTTGGAALVLCSVLTAYRHLATSMPAILAFAAISGVTAAGIIASAGIRRRKRETAELAAIAEVTQRALLRPVPAAVGPVKMAVRYMSAARGARVGGDLYETAAAEAGLRFIVGDVQGKGLPAVQTAATVLGAFRESAYDAPGLEEIAHRIEASLSRQPSSEQFVTALLGQVSADGTKVDLLNHGHPAPLLCSGGAVRFVEPGEAALPLGLAELAQAHGALVHGEPVTVALRPGDCMLCYTDGISEARNALGEFFPVSRSLAGADTAEPSTALAQLSDEVLRHVGHRLDDDAAMLLIRR